MVFMSSNNFSSMEKAIISRFAQFEPTPNTQPYKSACPHFKSIARLLQLNNNTAMDLTTVRNKEYISWFFLTSACLSRGAQGQASRMLPWAQIAGTVPPPQGPREDLDRMTYANFELGVLFTSRLTGDDENDRLYVSDSSHTHGCQCGKRRVGGSNNPLSKRLIKKCTRKIHLPVPYELRPRSYQEGYNSDMMTCTPYMNSITNGSTYNMMLTPLGQQMMMDSFVSVGNDNTSLQDDEGGRKRRRRRGNSDFET